MNLDALRAAGEAFSASPAVAPLDPAADALARALRPSYARERALHERFRDGDIGADGRSAAAIIRAERSGHGGTRWQCAACHLIGTVHGPGDTCTSCGYTHDHHGRGQHRAVSVS